MSPQFPQDGVAEAERKNIKSLLAHTQVLSWPRWVKEMQGGVGRAFQAAEGRVLPLLPVFTAGSQALPQTSDQCWGWSWGAPYSGPAGHLHHSRRAGDCQWHDGEGGEDWSGGQAVLCPGDLGTG